MNLKIVMLDTVLRLMPLVVQPTSRGRIEEKQVNDVELQRIDLDLLMDTPATFMWMIKVCCDSAIEFVYWGRKGLKRKI